MGPICLYWCLLMKEDVWEEQQVESSHANEGEWLQVDYFNNYHENLLFGVEAPNRGTSATADTPCIWPFRIAREEICVYGCAVQGPLKLWWKRMVITILVLKVLLRASIGMWYTSLSQSDAEDKLVPGASGIIHTTIQMTHLATYLRTGPTSVSSAGAINE